jgi:uncharacterized protein YjbI with pentapeptide repeats
MDPTVVAAWIAAGVGAATVISTVIVQIIGFRSSRADTERQIKATREGTADTLEQQRQQIDKTLKAQQEQLDRTLDAQSRQLDRTLGEQRTRTLNERFATAADQLGSGKSAVRLAGVYAMAGLVDDWEANRQTCVDVLCAYLRMPYEPDPDQDAPVPEQLAFQSNREVRHTVIRVITAHLQEDAAVSWQGLDLDFTGVVFDGGGFGGALFTGTARFDSARFSSGTVRFSGAEFSGGLVSFNHAEFSGGDVSFRGAKFSGAKVYFFDTRFSGAKVDFGHGQFSGAEVQFRYSEFSGGAVSFYGTEFSGSVGFSSARFSGAKVDFRDARFTAPVSFDYARFSGGKVDFTTTHFPRGEADFTTARDWSVPPAFAWRGIPPKGVKLPDTSGA